MDFVDSFRLYSPVPARSYMPGERLICCGDSAIVLGREEEIRRAARNIPAYMNLPMLV